MLVAIQNATVFIRSISTWLLIVTVTVWLVFRVKSSKFGVTEPPGTYCVGMKLIGGPT